MYIKLFWCGLNIFLGSIVFDAHTTHYLSETSVVVLVESIETEDKQIGCLQDNFSKGRTHNVRRYVRRNVLNTIFELLPQH